MKTTKRKLAELVLDFNLYPRVSVDSQHVGYLREAHEAGHALPPIIINGETNQVIDGFHRTKMYQQLDRNGDSVIEVQEKNYASDTEMLLAAMRYNAGHGRTLTRYDRTHCAILAEKLHIEMEELASALSISVERLGELKTDRIGEIKVGKTVTSVPLKRTIRHMAGHRMSQEQVRANDALGGMNQSFYANQLIILIKSGLLDVNDEKLMQRLQELHGLLEEIVMVKT